MCGSPGLPEGWREIWMRYQMLHVYTHARTHAQTDTLCPPHTYTHNTCTDTINICTYTTHIHIHTYITNFTDTVLAIMWWESEGWMQARTQGRCGSLTVHAQTHHAYPTHVMHWNYVRDRDARLVTIIKSSLYTQCSPWSLLYGRPRVQYVRKARFTGLKLVS